MAKTTSSLSLRRRGGDPCLPCRVAKAKCDYSEPQCTRCQVLGEQCKYVGILNGAKRTEQLQQRVSSLEAQIRKIINSHNRTVLSHRVFEQSRQFGVLPLRPQAPPPALRLFPYKLPLPPSNIPEDLVLAHSVIEVDHPSILSRDELEELFGGWRPELGITRDQSLTLIRLFLPKTSHCCFYFPSEALLERSALPQSDPQTLHPCLLNAIYLTACWHSEGILTQHIPYFVKETRRGLQESLAYADRITHFLWGSILFGIWLVRSGRFNEGFIVLSSTIIFALGCGLAGEGDRSRLLSPPTTGADAADRIHIIHVLYQMDRNMAMFTTSGSTLLSRQRFHNSGSGPMPEFHRALTNPLEVWPMALTPQEAGKRLDPIILGRTRVSLLHERVDMLTNSVFELNDQRLVAHGLSGSRLMEFLSIRNDIESATAAIPAHPLSHNELSLVDVNPDLIKLHVTHSGTITLFYNIVLGLEELGYEAAGVSTETARRKTLEASEALVGIATLAEPSLRVPDLSQYANLFPHFMNGTRVYLRELMRDPKTLSTTQAAQYCNSLSILMDFIQEMLVQCPALVPLAIPLRKILPTSPEDLRFSKQPRLKGKRPLSPH